MTSIKVGRICGHVWLQQIRPLQPQGIQQTHRHRRQANRQHLDRGLVVVSSFATHARSGVTVSSMRPSKFCKVIVSPF